MTERDESCVPSVDVSGSVFRPCGKAALGSVILVVVPGEPFVDVQTMDKGPLFWIDSRKVFCGTGTVLADRRPPKFEFLLDPTSRYFHRWEGRFSASEEKYVCKVELSSMMIFNGDTIF